MDSHKLHKIIAFHLGKLFVSADHLPYTIRVFLVDLSATPVVNTLHSSTTAWTNELLFLVWDENERKDFIPCVVISTTYHASTGVQFCENSGAI